MQEYITQEIKTKIAGKYDIIVAGSGPAGYAAAVTAGRMGIKTLLIEQGGCIGGISTAGLMSHWTGNVNSKLYREILELSTAHYEKGYAGKIEIDNEKLKAVYAETLYEANVDVLLYTFVADALMEGDKIIGVIAQNKSGRLAYFADVVIDGTGDGDVAYKAGAAYIKGREEDGKMQPATLMFKVAGVEKNPVYLWTFESTYQTEKGELQALARKLLPAPAGHVLLYPNPLPGIVTVNMTNCIEVDGTNAEDLTRAEYTCRKQMYAIEAFLREYVPGYQNCYIISSASLIGIRETRHFIGKKSITEEDISQARQFDDWVVQDAYFNFDVHSLTGSGLDKTGKQHTFTQKKGYTIPYGCLVPEKVKGLLLSGRCISGTHMAHSNFRAMPICLATGEAAGVAGAIAVKSKREVEDILPAEIQAYLL